MRMNPQRCVLLPNIPRRLYALEENLPSPSILLQQNGTDQPFTIEANEAYLGIKNGWHILPF
jgi:hypothetical protein